MTNRWGTMETVRDFILGGSKISADGTASGEGSLHGAAMNLKDICSLEEKLGPT